MGSDKEILGERRAKAKVIIFKDGPSFPAFRILTRICGSAPWNARLQFLAPRVQHYARQSRCSNRKNQSLRCSHPKDKVLIGRGDFGTVPPAVPNHELLDLAVSDRPLIVHNTSEHALWVNAKALAFAGINDQPIADPAEERYVVRDASGHPSGLLLESAMELVERAVFVALSRDEKLAMLREAAHYLNRFGITSVVNATGSLPEIELYAALRDRGELTVRTRTSFGAVAVNHHLSPQFLADLEEARTRYHDGWVSANLVKFFADGGSGMIPPLTI